MNFARKFEFVSGVATVLLGLIVSVWLLAVLDSLPSPKELGLLLLADFLFFIGPGLLVAFGSDTHAVKRKSSGFIMIMLGTLILIVTMLLNIFGGGLYAYGLWGGLGVLTPSITALLTLISSLAVKNK